MKARDRPAWLEREEFALVLPAPLPLPLCSGKRCIGWGEAPPDEAFDALELGEDAPLLPALEVPVFGPPSETEVDALDFGLRPVTDAAAAFDPLGFGDGGLPSVARDAVLAAAEGLAFVPEFCPASLAPLVWDEGCTLA